jgi:hypothetical protein
MFGWRVQRNTTDLRMAQGSRVATSLGEACTASTVQADASWRHSAFNAGPISWDAQLEGCGAVRRHVASESTYCSRNTGRSPLAAQRVQDWACPLGWRGSAVWLWSRWLDVALARRYWWNHGLGNGLHIHIFPTTILVSYRTHLAI